MTGAQLMNLMMSISYLGILLLAGKLLRIKIPIFQKLFFPAALIAGFLGIALGPYGAGLITKPMMSMWAMFPGRLIDVVFTCVFLGTVVPSLKDMWYYAGPQLTYSWFIISCQWIVGISVGYFILEPIWGIPAFVGTIIEIGWAGGHGTAGGMATVFKNLGFPEGGDLALTSATVGLVVGIVFGMVLINMAVRKGYTVILKSPDSISASNLSGILPEERVIAKSKITTDAIEPFAFHCALICLAIVIGSYMLEGLKFIHPKFSSVPLFPIAMLAGVAIQMFMVATKTADLLNRQVIERIQGTALDFLVVAAVASIQIPVVIKYAVPLFILMFAAFITMYIITWYVAPRVLPDAWFERAIAEYGALSGVLAAGLMLLRVVDPDLQTSAPKAFAFERPLFSPFVGGGLITSIIPIMVYEMGAITIIGASVALALALLMVAKLNGWFRAHPGPYKQ